MYDLKEIYKESKYLDELFDELYEPSKEIDKDILELLVEIGEFANATRCFKYWSNKGMSSKDVVLEEYIDCLFMVLRFCNYLNVSLEEKFPESDNKNLMDTLFIVYHYGMELNENLNKENCKKLLVELLHIASLLGFSETDLVEGTKNKSNIIQERFKNDY